MTVLAHLKSPDEWVAKNISDVAVATAGYGKENDGKRRKKGHDKEGRTDTERPSLHRIV